LIIEPEEVQMSDGMKVLEQVIRQATVRNGVLTSNIANVDTPNYRAKDVKFSQVLGNEMSMTVTDARHIRSGPGENASGEVQEEDGKPWADKNNVEMDQEVAKMTENAMLFEAGITLLKKKIQMFKNALKTS
jgi:flagellar basal-body rod protein FlgB